MEFSRDFKTFPREKFQNVKFSQGKVPKCKIFSFTNWNFLFSSLEKIFSRPNSGDKKMKFYILELFLNSGEDFQNIFHFKFFFEMKYILKIFIPLTEKVPKCKISFFISPTNFETQSLLEKYLLPRK